MKSTCKNCVWYIPNPNRKGIGLCFENFTEQKSNITCKKYEKVKKYK